MKKPTLTAIGGTDVEPRPDAEKFYNELEVDVLARTLWGEARGEGAEGMKAVACVVLNRVKVAKRRGSFWWGNDLIQVCQKPYQFSCWNRSDPNFQKLQNVNDSNTDFVIAKGIARRAVLSALSDITSGATHYHAKGILPYWAKHEEPVVTIGNHIFYVLVEG